MSIDLMADEAADEVRAHGQQLSLTDYIDYLEAVRSSLRADIDAAKDDLRRHEH